MKILISNDDGIFAPGLMALVRAFSAAGHAVYVAAPDSQRSAASHSMTLFQPLTARARAVEGAEKAWAIDGTPVDCVKLAVKALCPEVEFVISGVNHGYNAGSDVLYSGTVGAAMEGAREAGVLYAPGDAFYPDGRGRNCIRLGFSRLTPEQIEKGIGILSNYIASLGG